MASPRRKTISVSKFIETNSCSNSIQQHSYVWNTSTAFIHLGRAQEINEKRDGTKNCLTRSMPFFLFNTILTPQKFFVTNEFTKSSL